MAARFCSSGLRQHSLTGCALASAAFAGGIRSFSDLIHADSSNVAPCAVTNHAIGHRRTVGRKWNGELVAYTQLPKERASVPLRLLKWDERENSWVETKEDHLSFKELPEQLKVMTMNIWEDQWENIGTLREGCPAAPNSRTQAELRMQMIAELVVEETPDLLALQEVTEPLALQLLAHPVMRGYYVTTIDHVPTHPNCPSGHLLCSRWPLEDPRIYALPSNNGRNFAAAFVSFSSSSESLRLLFGTFHMESSPKDVALRADQARCIGTICLDQGEVCLICGDTNVKDDPKPLHFGLGEIDAWRAVHASDPGYTRGPNVVPVNVPEKWNADYRMDRILTAGTVKVEECRLIGMLPKETSSGRVWPSDHLGLVAKVRFLVQN